MLIKSPVIVVGVPRSGTSNIAQCLVEHFNIRMCLDRYAGMPEKYNTFEDSTVVNLNRLLNVGNISLTQYKNEMAAFFEAMQQTKKPWGFKDPRLIVGLPWVVSYFKDCSIIRTHRDSDLVVKSLTKKLKWNLELARFTVQNQIKIIDQTLSGIDVINVNYGSTTLPETDLIRIISDGITLKTFENECITDAKRMIAQGAY